MTSHGLERLHMIHVKFEVSIVLCQCTLSRDDYLAVILFHIANNRSSDCFLDKSAADGLWESQSFHMIINKS